MRELIKIILHFVDTILFFSFAFLSCSSFHPYPQSCYKIEGIPGPEDFVLIENGNQFLISSHNRRDFQSHGEIFSYNPETNQIFLLKREMEPENLSFRPHGIDYREPYLYVVLHGENPDTDWHAVAVYELKDNKLMFRKLFRDPLIYSPNDLITISEDEFFITNDMKKRGSSLELLGTLIFGINRGSIVYCNIRSNLCYKVYEGLGFPNSLAVFNNQLFISTTLEDKIYEFSIIRDNVGNYALSSKRLVAKIPGPDNLILYNDKIYVSSHPSMWKFAQHSRSAENISPSVGYEIDPVQHSVKKILEDSGERISAASVIVNIQSGLFIGQVFDSYLLRCVIDD